MYGIVGFLVGLGIFIFNLFDALGTYVGIEFGLAREINPVMIFIMDIIGDWFMLVKALLGAILFYLIYISWENINRLTRAFCIGVLIFYFLLAIYHFILMAFYYR